MVAITTDTTTNAAKRRSKRMAGSSGWSPRILFTGVIVTVASGLVVWIAVALWLTSAIEQEGTGVKTHTKAASSQEKSLRKTIDSKKPPNDNGNIKKKSTSVSSYGVMESSSVCPYQSMNDLTSEERFPKAGPHRHIVDPPLGGWVDLVCCQTTKGPWNILVHETWAPLGSKRFLDMVRSNYFSKTPQGVPLMRCIKNFLCQFGLNGHLSNEFRTLLKDDPQWLPTGPTNRVNDLGVQRFQKGYMSYAGGGPNTRSNQLFVALDHDRGLGGGSPWEVPWGELVGTHSFATLDKIYYGYGEQGPSQQWLHNHNSSHAELKEKFPLLDYVTSCHVVDRELQKDPPGQN